MDIAELVTKLSLDTTKFKAGQTQANASLKAMGEGAAKTGADVQKVAQGMAQGFARVRTELLGLLGLFLAGKSIGGLAREVTNQDAALGRLSYRLGISTQDLSAWDRAAQSTGAASGEAMGGIAALSTAFERFRLTGQGGDTFIPYLTRLGVHLTNANGQMKTATEQQLEFARAFQEMDRTDRKATDFLGGQIPGMTQGMIDLLRRGPEFVQQRLDKQKAIGLPTRQDTVNAQNILEQLGYVDQRAMTFGRHLLNDVSPGITRVLTRLGDWLDRHLPGWYATIDPMIKDLMKSLESIDFDDTAKKIHDFAVDVRDVFKDLWDWMKWIRRQFGGGGEEEPKPRAAPADGKPAAAPAETPSPFRRFMETHFGQNNFNPTGTKADDAEMAAADRNGVPRDFARKIFAIEKGVDEDGRARISPAGAIGAGQLMPDTAKDLGVDPYNLEQNVDGSTRYMRQLIERFHGNQAAAAAAYNAGPNNPAVQRFADTGDASGLPAEMQKYVERFNRRWFEADRSGRNAEMKPLDHDGGLGDRLRIEFEKRLVYRVPSLPVPSLPPLPPLPPPIFKFPEDGKDQPGDAGAENPDFVKLKRFLDGKGAQPPAPAPEKRMEPIGAGAFLVTDAKRRWAQETHSTVHHDNRSETHVGAVHIHTQARDAHGIARDLKGALQSRAKAAQANRGVT